MSKRVFLVVLDSVGIGEMPDAAAYGDTGSNTLGAIAGSSAFSVPNLERLGLFHIDGVALPAKGAPQGAFGRLAEASSGKDTTTGHWEIAGVISEQAMPTYPNGFPDDVIAELEQRFGRKVLCNKPYSGTQVIEDYGQEHLETGALIVYTSADSVLQIAAHEELVPLAELYRYCEIAREMMQGEHGVGRIIARPFVGSPGHFARTENRHDYSLAPPRPTMCDLLAQAGYSVIGVGKINDIFAGSGITRHVPSGNNEKGMERLAALLEEEFTGLCFVNLVDFDMLYGHRNDVDGYAAAMTRFDQGLGALLPRLRQEDLLLITADHGCDPSTPSTDHSREYVPLLVCGAGVRSGVNLGTRSSFADIAATVQEYFGLALQTQGESFLQKVVKK